MQFDFTTQLERHGMDALAVDGLGDGSGFAPGRPQEGFDSIPMWVADMNFPTVPAIPEAVARRAMHPAYGYFTPTQDYYRAIIRWQAERNGVTGLRPSHIGYENGVLGGVVSALNTLCSRGDGVLLHAPTYIGFTHCLRDNGYRPVLSPLRRDEAGVWRMDLADMEAKLAQYHIHAAIFCSPHNPCGRVWTAPELEAMLELFRRYDVYVISDEIWSDLTLPGQRHIPTQSVSADARERVIALYAPSKTFNLAGLIGSYHIIYNRRLRDRVERESALSHYNSMNVLSMHALIAAYSEQGQAWVDELRQVLGENVDFAWRWFRDRCPGVEVARPEGTYMLFLDCTGWCRAHGTDIEQLLRAGWAVGVTWQDGRPFHGLCHIRMNLALPRSRVEEAFRRLEQYVFTG